MATIEVLSGGLRRVFFCEVFSGMVRGLLSDLSSNRLKEV